MEANLWNWFELGMLSELKRYYRAAKIFRFFFKHSYIYFHIFRDILEKKIGVGDYVRPRNIVLKITNKCNAHCRFCYAQREEQKLKELSLSDWKDVIDQSQEIGCYTVTLSGGEPLIYPHIMDIVEYVRSKDMLAFTTTNGLAATPDRLVDLERAGLCALNFSIHGPRDHHDALVGVPGAFDILMRHAEFACARTELVCLVNHVLTRESIANNWFKLIWDIAKALGFRALNILPICVNGTSRRGLLNAQELKVLDGLAEQPHVLMDTKNYSTPRCPAGREDLLVNNFGEVQPCPFIPISFGNIRQSSLKEAFLCIQNHEMFAIERSICMPARDHEFINRWIIPAFHKSELPARIQDLDYI